jgi:hypothetical protein
MDMSRPINTNGRKTARATDALTDASAVQVMPKAKC